MSKVRTDDVSFSYSDDEKSCFIFLRYLLASGFPGCLGVGSFDGVGLLKDLDQGSS